MNDPANQRLFLPARVAFYAMVGLAPILACSREKHTQPVTLQDQPQTRAPSAVAADAGALQRLRDPNQAVRDAAAAEVRKAIADNPDAAGDPGEAYWKAKLAALKPGITSAEFLAATGAEEEGGASSGRSSTQRFRLDDYWTVAAYFDLPDKLREIGTLTRSARPLWVDPPKAFSGRWVTYYVNGRVDNDIQYRQGVYERFTQYYDNGQLAHVQVYIDGEIDGPETGFHRDGSRAYEIHHARGKPAGRWVFWYPNGKQESEESYVNGKREGPSLHWREDGTKQTRIDYKQGVETGQAAWDEHGTLLFAHGTAQAPSP